LPIDGAIVVATLSHSVLLVNLAMSMRSWWARIPEIPRIRLNPMPILPACRPVHFSQPYWWRSSSWRWLRCGRAQD